MSPLEPLDCTIVVPTIGRACLGRLLAALADARGPRPAQLVLVDDGHDGDGAGVVAAASRPGLPPARVARCGGRGPAAARNFGWRLARTEWVAFLDDDVVPGDDWYDRLAADLVGLPDRVAGSQGRIHVPLPADRRPTDWERNTAGLQGAWWITADMAYRRAALAAVGGFDERFRRAFREDADLALRVRALPAELVRGSRRTAHPVRPAGRWVSVRAQAGNADDVLMRRLHGPHWRERVGAPRGRRQCHLAITAAGLAGVALTLAGRHGAGTVALSVWAAGTGELALAWTRPGRPSRSSWRPCWRRAW
jgi:glycosyltransferase involved in cell wall biosynthesis